MERYAYDLVYEIDSTDHEVGVSAYGFMDQNDSRLFARTLLSRLTSAI